MTYSLDLGEFPCGRTFCPAVLRLLWPVKTIRVGEIAGLTRVTPGSIWRRVEQIGCYDARPKRKKPRYSLTLFRALWADNRLSLAEIGERLGGLHPVNVGEHGRRLGLPPRATGAKPRAIIGPEFAQMWRIGVKTREIARFYGIGQPRVSRIAADLGLELRVPPVPQGKLTLDQFREWQLGQRMARDAAEINAALGRAKKVDRVHNRARAA